MFLNHILISYVIYAMNKCPSIMFNGVTHETMYLSKVTTKQIQESTHFTPEKVFICFQKLFLHGSEER